jgi:hypothetical protein
MKRLKKFEKNLISNVEMSRVKAGFAISHSAICALNDAVLATSLDESTLRSAMNTARTFCADYYQ